MLLKALTTIPETIDAEVIDTEAIDTVDRGGDRQLTQRASTVNVHFRVKR